MPKIHVLDQNTINQIAAGEVIERPMAVVMDYIISTKNSIEGCAGKCDYGRGEGWRKRVDPYH